MLRYGSCEPKYGIIVKRRYVKYTERVFIGIPSNKFVKRIVNVGNIAENAKLNASRSTSSIAFGKKNSEIEYPQPKNSAKPKII